MDKGRLTESAYSCFVRHLQLRLFLLLEHSSKLFIIYVRLSGIYDVHYVY
jgi:hypothetical protein